MELTTSLNDTSVEAPDDDTILRAILSIVDGNLDGEQVFLGHGPDDDEQILSVAAYYEGTGWILFVGRHGLSWIAKWPETRCPGFPPQPLSRSSPSTRRPSDIAVPCEDGVFGMDHRYSEHQPRFQRTTLSYVLNNRTVPRNAARARRGALPCLTYFTTFDAGGAAI